MHTTFKCTKVNAETSRCSVRCFGRKLLHLHTSGARVHTPNSKSGVDSWCAMPPVHIQDADVGWSQLLRPHPRQWCSHCWWHVLQDQPTLWIRSVEPLPSRLLADYMHRPWHQKCMDVAIFLPKCWTEHLLLSVFSLCIFKGCVYCNLLRTTAEGCYMVPKMFGSI